MMATRKSTPTRKTTRRSSNTRKASGAIALLTADHDKVKKLFKQFERLHEDQDDEGAAQIAAQICNELTVHATIEEELFYPQVRDAIDDADLVDEAEVEHATAKDLIAQIESMDSTDDKYAAKVMVLGEYINHHIKEEQNEMFPKARRAKLDMEALGEQLIQRKHDLMAERGMDEEAESASRSLRGRRSTSRSSDARRA
jgi:hemerythrin-like domain-containing protein